MHGELRASLRRLLLPVALDKEPAAVAAIQERLNALGIHGADQAEYLRQRVDEWRSTHGTLSGALRDLIEVAISAGGLAANDHLAKNYCKLHSKLQREHALKFDEAAALLSYCEVIYDLAVAHWMSASAISRLLSAHGIRGEVPWRAVQHILEALGVKPALEVGSASEPGTIEGLICADREEADERFLDADISGGAELVSAAAAELGFEGDLQQHLLTLCDADGGTFVPYLQILHFQCMVAAFYDHPVTMVYEFSPRGRNAGFLRDTYRFLTHTADAFLNNMKAVERLDRAWARGRKQERVRAHALVAILEGMERMAFLPRIELAAWLRQWLVRITLLGRPPANPVPNIATETSVRKVLTVLATMRNGTNTGGVIEQRIVDAVAATIHREEEGWRARGLGFPVSASNLSSRRLGDCDFQRPPQAGVPAQLVAYEATGGRLTRTYLEGHLQTLRRSVAARIGELEGVTPRSNWRVRIVFVAHEFGGGLGGRRTLPSAEYQGLRIELEFQTYSEFQQAAEPAQLVPSFTKNVHEVLNEWRTPRAAREVFLKMLT